MQTDSFLIPFNVCDDASFLCVCVCECVSGVPIHTFMQTMAEIAKCLSIFVAKWNIYGRFFRSGLTVASPISALNRKTTWMDFRFETDSALTLAAEAAAVA